MSFVSDTHSDVLALPAHYAAIEPEEAVYLDGGISLLSVAVTGFAIYGAYCAYTNINAYLESNPSVSEQLQQTASSALRVFITAFTTIAVVKLSYDIIVSIASSKSE
jgi:hypothetical protein